MFDRITSDHGADISNFSHQSITSVSNAKMSLSLVLIVTLFMCCSAQDCGQFTTSDQEGPFFVPGVPNNYRQTCKRCFKMLGMESTTLASSAF